MPDNRNAYNKEEHDWLGTADWKKPLSNHPRLEYLVKGAGHASQERTKAKSYLFWVTHPAMILCI